MPIVLYQQSGRAAKEKERAKIAHLQQVAKIEAKAKEQDVGHADPWTIGRLTARRRTRLAAEHLQLRPMLRQIQATGRRAFPVTITGLGRILPGSA